MDDLNMVKKAAEAIWNCELLLEADECLRAARAVLQTIREPSARMLAVGESAASFGIGKPVDDDAMPRVWQAMIDAALAE